MIYLRFSTKLTKGVRIGAVYKLTSTHRTPGLTVSERKKIETQKFIDHIENRYKKAMSFYWIRNARNPLRKYNVDKRKVEFNVNDLVGLGEFSKNVIKLSEKIKSIIEPIKNAGVNLTQKKREQLYNAVTEIEKIVNISEPSEFERTIFAYEAQRKSYHVGFIFWLIIGLTGLHYTYLKPIPLYARVMFFSFLLVLLMMFASNVILIHEYNLFKAVKWLFCWGLICLWIIDLFIFFPKIRSTNQKLKETLGLTTSSES